MVVKTAQILRLSGSRAHGNPRALRVYFERVEACVVEGHPPRGDSELRSAAHTSRIEPSEPRLGREAFHLAAAMEAMLARVHGLDRAYTRASVHQVRPEWLAAEADRANNPCAGHNNAAPHALTVFASRCCCTSLIVSPTVRTLANCSGGNLILHFCSSLTMISRM